MGMWAKRNAPLNRCIKWDKMLARGENQHHLCHTWRCCLVKFFLAKAKPVVPVKALSFVIHTLGRNAQDFVENPLRLSSFI